MSFSKVVLSTLVAAALGVGASACSKGGPDKLAQNNPSAVTGSNQFNQVLPGPSGMQSANEAATDRAITAQVKSALIKEPSLQSSQINVETVDGVVKLDGFVNSQQDADRAGEIAGNTGKVKSVENNLQVKPAKG